ncbi:MAG: acyltransferase family protein [Clostridia bacterium]|nr:acyltransferase family protein [Clostridia bacterium]
MTQTKARDIGMDLVKCIAIISVLIIHTCLYSGDVGSFEWSSSLFWGSITRGSVPLFLMASGAVMLQGDKEISLKKLYFKNILRIVAAMIFWGIAYKICHLIQNDTLNYEMVIHSVKEVFVFNQEFHFYYMHIIIIVYAFIPITRVLVHNCTKNQLSYLIVLWLALAVIYPNICVFWPFNLISGVVPLWKMNMVYAGIGYGILGYYLKKYPLPTWLGLTMILCGFTIVFGGTYWVSTDYGILQEHFYSGMGIGATLLATGIFSLADRVMLEDTVIKKSIIWLSKASFCIYLCHMLIMYALSVMGINAEMFTPIVSIPCVALINIILSSVVYFVISKIPLLRKWII